MDVATFSLLVVSCIICGWVAFLMGVALSYARGYDDGWDEADAFYDKKDDIAAIKFTRVIGAGKSYLQADGTPDQKEVARFFEEAAVNSTQSDRGRPIQSSGQEPPFDGPGRCDLGLSSFATPTP